MLPEPGRFVNYNCPSLNGPAPDRFGHFGKKCKQILNPSGKPLTFPIGMLQWFTP